MMKFETSQDKTSNSPIPRDKLAALIQSTYTTLQEQGTASVDLLLQRVLEQLNAHSSFYKYVVSVTTLESSLEPHNSEDCTMSNAIGASWNSRKDGLFNYDLPDEQKGVKHLVTVIWVAKQ